MAQYRFYVQRGATNMPLSGVRIVHDPAICREHGLNCDFARTLSTTTIGGNAMLAMPHTQMNHWFRATYPGPPQEIQENNQYTGEFGGSRAMEFNF